MHSYLSSWEENAQVLSRHVIYTNLNSNCQNLPNMSYTHKGQFGKICVTKLRRKKQSSRKNVKANEKIIIRSLNALSQPTMTTVRPKMKKTVDI